jgi:hypothetical protein
LDEVREMMLEMGSAWERRRERGRERGYKWGEHDGEVHDASFDPAAGWRRPI